MMQFKKVVLASGSQFKKKIFQNFADKNNLDVDFSIMPSSLGDDDERAIVNDIIKGVKVISLDLAKKATSTLAYNKALDVFSKLDNPSNTMVVGADSAILLGNVILDKYKSEEEAVETLYRLCNSEHYVLTGMSFVSNDVRVFETDVTVISPIGASIEYCEEWVSKIGKDKVLSICGYTMTPDLQQIMGINDNNYNSVIGLSTVMIKDHLLAVKPVNKALSVKF